MFPRMFKPYLVLLPVLAGLVFFSIDRISALYPIPYPHFDRLVMQEDEGFQDIAGLVMGFRKASADIAWVQLIQYCGGEQVQESAPGGEKKLGKLKTMTERVVRIDPYFHEAYLFSAGILAWFKSVDRPEEAVELLEEGISNNPRYWQFRIYLAAIMYKNKGDYGRMLSKLEEAVSYPDCPNIIKTILANYYKMQEEYGKALAVWKSVLDSGDTSYLFRAEEQVFELERLITGNEMFREIK